MRKIAAIVTLLSAFISWSCGRQESAKPLEAKQEKSRAEQAVLVYIKLSDNEHGTHEERESIFKLESELEKKIDLASLGEYDGNEFGDGFVTLYMYGPDANRLFDAVIETIRNYKPGEGSYVIKRYGSPGAKEERVVL